MELPIFIFIVACFVTSALAEDYLTKYGLAFRSLGDSCDEPVVGVQFLKLFYKMTFDTVLHIDGKPVVGKLLDGGGQSVISRRDPTGPAAIVHNVVDEVLIQGLKGLENGCDYTTADLYLGATKVATLYRKNADGRVDNKYLKFLPAEWKFEFHPSANSRDCSVLRTDLKELYGNIHFEANRDSFEKVSVKAPEAHFYAESTNEYFPLEQLPVGRALAFTDSNMEKLTIKAGITVAGLDPDCRYDTAHLQRLDRQEHIMTFVAMGDVAKIGFKMSPELTISIRESKFKGVAANEAPTVYFKPADKWTFVFKGGANGSVADERVLTVVNKRMIAECYPEGELDGRLEQLFAKKEVKTLFTFPGRDIQILQVANMKMIAKKGGEIFMRDEMEDSDPSWLEGFEVTMKSCKYKQLVIYRWPDKKKGRLTKIATYDLPTADVARQSLGTNAPNAAKTKSTQRSRRAHKSKKGSRKAHRSKKGSR